MYIANGAGDCSKEFHCPEVELQNAPYGKGLTSILRELLQNILENTIVPFFEGNEVLNPVSVMGEDDQISLEVT